MSLKNRYWCFINQIAKSIFLLLTVHQATITLIDYMIETWVCLMPCPVTICSLELINRFYGNETSIFM